MTNDEPRHYSPEEVVNLVQNKCGRCEVVEEGGFCELYYGMLNFCVFRLNNGYTPNQEKAFVDQPAIQESTARIDGCDQQSTQGIDDIKAKYPLVNEN